MAAQCRASVEGVWSPLSLLDAVAGDADLMADVLDVFNHDTGARIHRMRAALAGFDLSKMRVEAHTIKGGAKQVGADALAAACQELEAISTVQEASLAAARLNRVQELFENVRRAMAAYSGNRSPDPSAPPSI